jgi:hypothetical protein
LQHVAPKLLQNCLEVEEIIIGLQDMLAVGAQYLLSISQKTEVGPVNLFGHDPGNFGKLAIAAFIKLPLLWRFHNLFISAKQGIVIQADSTPHDGPRLSKPFLEEQLSNLL